MESAVSAHFRKVREMRLLAYAAAISLAFHLVPLFLFTVQMPERGPEIPDRVELGMTLRGMELVDMQKGVTPPPDESSFDPAARIDAPDAVSRRSWDVETVMANLQRPDRISTVENPVETGEWAAVLPRREFSPETETTHSLQRVASLSEATLPPGPILPEIPKSRVGSNLTLPPARETAPAETFLESTGLTDGDPGLRQRRILAMPKPIYPAGENTATRVVLRFNVLPDGSVIDVRVERKGGPAFDLEATRTLRKWRFEPLPAQVPQTTQWGRVVIRFSVE